MEPLEVSEPAANANEAKGRVPQNPWKSFRVVRELILFDAGFAFPLTLQSQWMVLLAMGVAKFQAALDLTAVSTALPTIS